MMTLRLLPWLFVMLVGMVVASPVRAESKTPLRRLPLKCN
jgi:uncharacterized membrane protein